MAAPASTAGAAVMVTSPTIPATTRPATSATTLYRGHATPAIVISGFGDPIDRMCSAVVIGSGYPLNMVSGSRNISPRVEPHKSDA
jgi:hypothetical protein